jgi:hypothetical protein
MQRQSVSHSYGVVDTSRPWILPGGREGRDRIQRRASSRADWETAKNRADASAQVARRCQLPDATAFAGALQTEDSTMTMLTPTRGRFERAAYSSESRNRIGPGGAGVRLATVRRLCISALLVAMACVALTAIMALKVIVYLPRFHT